MGQALDVESEATGAQGRRRSESSTIGKNGDHTKQQASGGRGGVPGLQGASELLAVSPAGLVGRRPACVAAAWLAAGLSPDPGWRRHGRHGGSRTQGPGGQAA